MRQLVKLTVVGMCLLTLSACKNPKPKSKIDRAAKAGESTKAGGGSEFTKALLTPKANCFDLSKFKNAAAQLSTLTVYTQDVDLVERQAISGDACVAFAPNTHAELETARRLQTIERTWLRSFTAEGLVNSLPVLGAKTQTACTAVEFETGPAFKVLCASDKVNPSRLVLQSADGSEYRFYGFDQSGLTVTVYTRLASVQTCDGTVKPAGELYEKLTLKVVPSDSVTTVRLKAKYLETIKGTLKSVPTSLQKSLDGAKGKDKTPAREDVDLNLGTLLNIVEQASAKNVCPK